MFGCWWKFFKWKSKVLKSKSQVYEAEFKKNSCFFKTVTLICTHFLFLLLIFLKSPIGWIPNHFIIFFIWNIACLILITDWLIFFEVWYEGELPWVPGVWIIIICVFYVCLCVWEKEKKKKKKSKENKIKEH
jgi:hypothetical protein